MNPRFLNDNKSAAPSNIAAGSSHANVLTRNVSFFVQMVRPVLEEQHDAPATRFPDQSFSGMFRRA